MPDVKAAGKGKNVKKQTMVVAATVEPSEIAPAPGEQESEASESSSLCSADEDEDAHEAGDRAAAAAAEAAEPAEGLAKCRSGVDHRQLTAFFVLYFSSGFPSSADQSSAGGQGYAAVSVWGRL